MLRDAKARGARRVAHPPWAAAPGWDPAPEPDWQAAAATSLAAALAVPERAGTRGWRLRVWRWLLARTIRAEQAGARAALVSAREAVRLREEATRRAGTDRDAALALADRALALAPQNQACLLLGARLRRDRAAATAGDSAARDRADAIAILRRAVALRPQDPRPVAQLCAALKEAGRLAEAVDAAEFCAICAPRVPEHWELAARLAGQARQDRRARMMLQLALVAAPQRIAAHRGLAARHRAAALAQARLEMAERLEAIAARRQAGR
jgi:hypothetical protein